MRLPYPANGTLRKLRASIKNSASSANSAFFSIQKRAVEDERISEKQLNEIIAEPRSDRSVAPYYATKKMLHSDERQGSLISISRSATISRLTYR